MDWKKLSGPGILQLGNLEQYTIIADTERTSFLVIKTVPSVQPGQNEMYDEYVYVKQFVTRKKFLTGLLTKLCQQKNDLKWCLTSTKTMFLSQMYLRYQSSSSAFLEPTLSLKGYFPSWIVHGVNTLKAMSVTKVNYDKTCVEFFKILLTKKYLLKKIQNSKKYSSFVSSYF
jgi:hypothetical protein